MIRTAITVVIALVALRLVIGALEPRFVFFPYKGEDENPGSLGIPYRQIELTASDGVRLVAWQLEPEHPVADVVYFHGNGGNLSVWLPALAALHQMQLRVLAIDYRGYGLSGGTPSEKGVYRDAEAAVRHAIANRTAGRPLVFWGRSLGGPVAAYATTVTAPDGLILESSFASKGAVAATQPVLRVLNLFTGYRFDTVRHLRGFSGPVLVMHGDADRVIPFRLSRDLFDRLREPKRFAVIAGADHNDLFDPRNRPYWAPVLAFVDDLPAS